MRSFFASFASIRQSCFSASAQFLLGSSRRHDADDDKSAPAPPRRAGVRLLDAARAGSPTRARDDDFSS